MVYEIYLDSLFVEVFFWQYCVLSLTNAGFYKASGRWRILFGAVLGTLGYLLSLFLPFPAFGRIAFAAACSGGALWFTFSVKSFPVFLKVLGNYLKYAILLGGSMLLVLRLPFAGMRGGKFFLSLLTLCLMTAAGFAMQRRSGAERAKNTGRAVLLREGKKICVDALVDSGNSLTEPISGKPVCVLDQNTARALWGEGVLQMGSSLSGDEIPFRMIPYRSVGKKGLMKGYLLPEMRLELGGPSVTFYDVYMAVSPQDLTKEEGKSQVLIHPAMISQNRQKNQSEKEREAFTK